MTNDKPLINSNGASHNSRPYLAQIRSKSSANSGISLLEANRFNPYSVQIACMSRD